MSKSSSASINATEENDRQENVDNYAKFGLEGTSWLAFRDVPLFIRKYVCGKDTLDYGCGNGRSTRFLKVLGLHVIGMDISSSMVDYAKKTDPTGQYYQIESGHIPAANESYDLVFSIHVFIVVSTKAEIARILKEVRRVLKSTGTFIVVTGSENYHSKKMEWLSYNIDFPENDILASGSLAKVQLKNAGVEFYDYNWLDEDYLQLFKENGFTLVDKHFPLGKKEDNFDWKSEMHHSPFVIYTLKLSHDR